MLRFHRNLPALSCPKKTSAPKTQLSPIQPQSQSPHSAPFHTARCIASRSTLHRPKLHVASPQAPRCINPPYSKSLFPPRVEGPSRPYSPSCPVCCDSIATCPRFSSTFRLLPELPAHSRSVRLLHVCFPPCGAALFLTFPRPFLRFPVPYVAIPSQPARAFRPLSACCPLFQLFPPLTACLPIRPLFFLLLSPAWPGGNTEKALRDCSRRASD